MTIRTATMNDLNAITAVEAECFPAAEAASREEFSKRLTYYNDHFWLMFDEDKLIAFVDGFVTDEETLNPIMAAQNGIRCVLHFMSRNFIRSTVKCNGNFLLIGLNSG